MVILKMKILWIRTKILMQKQKKRNHLNDYAFKISMLESHCVQLIDIGLTKTTIIGDFPDD